MQHRLVVLCKIVRTAILGLSEPSALDQASLPKGLLSFFKPSRASVISHADAAARGSRGSVHVAWSNQNRDSGVSGYLLAPAKRSAAPSASCALSIISELETLLSRNYSLLPRLQQLQRPELQSVSIDVFVTHITAALGDASDWLIDAAHSST